MVAYEEGDLDRMCTHYFHEKAVHGKTRPFWTAGGWSMRLVRNIFANLDLSST